MTLHRLVRCNHCHTEMITARFDEPLPMMEIQLADGAIDHYCSMECADAGYARPPRRPLDERLPAAARVLLVQEADSASLGRLLRDLEDKVKPTVLAANDPELLNRYRWSLDLVCQSLELAEMGG